MNQAAPANTSRTQRRNLLGDIPRLPLRVAVQVAWTSIRVRMSRSLVTVSSVILAVAFLLVVLGENVCVRAMHRVYAADVASVDGAQALRDVLDRRRSPLVMLTLLARDPAGTARWSEALLARPLPAVEPAGAVAAVELADWLRRLSASQSYLLQRNRNATEWLLAFETPDQVDALIATAK
ncbi:MAG: hypothetical protein H0W72_15180, partial [Planctomycetes bacterium]|nr:hypothetical protein [Planctomycetota bacterium]